MTSIEHCCIKCKTDSERQLKFIFKGENLVTGFQIVLKASRIIETKCSFFEQLVSLGPV